MISFAYITCWSPSSCEVITSDLYIPLTTFYKVFFCKPKKEENWKRSFLRFVLSTQRNQFTEEIFKNSENLPRLFHHILLPFISSVKMWNDMSKRDSLVLCVFNTKKDRKTKKGTFQKMADGSDLSSTRQSLTLSPGPGLVFLRQGKREIFIAFFFLILGNKRD